jgi:hypothetical protein
MRLSWNDNRIRAARIDLFSKGVLVVEQKSAGKHLILAKQQAL